MVNQPGRAAESCKPVMKGRTGKSFGAKFRLPWEQGANTVIKEDKKLITFKYFFTRS